MKQYEANSLTVLVLKALKKSLNNKQSECPLVLEHENGSVSALIKRIETEQLDITLKSRNE